MENIDHFAIKARDLEVYKLAFNSAMEIYHLTKYFPKEEQFSLTDQIRRSSRSVCSNLSEGWHKRRYPAAFINKLTDSLQEAAETQTWLEFSLACHCIEKGAYDKLILQYEKIIAQLITMQNKAYSFCPKK